MLSKNQIKKDKKILIKKSFITKAIGIYIVITLLTGLFVFVPSISADPDWYNINWNYRKAITINHNMVQEDLTNFTVFVDIVSGDFVGHVQSDGDDFVFTNVSGFKLSH
ncbi:MAG: hypothetical protein QHH15_02860, partial [Candidatus Thermoplasmatota archaeon]|nr:hypothetical protein [Candidatus Thermoplasmatota archaeon]